MYVSYMSKTYQIKDEREFWNTNETDWNVSKFAENKKK